MSRGRRERGGWEVGGGGVGGGFTKKLKRVFGV